MIILLKTGRPTEPRDLKVISVDESSVTLKWTPPASDGGSKVKNYIIEKRDVSRRTYTQVGSTASCEFKVTRLVQGNDYVFQVSAENDVGAGNAAELSQSITAKSPYSKLCLKQ